MENGRICRPVDRLLRPDIADLDAVDFCRFKLGAFDDDILDGYFSDDHFTPICGLAQQFGGLRGLPRRSLAERHGSATSSSLAAG